jgi:hypothetical protein
MGMIILIISAVIGTLVSFTSIPKIIELKNSQSKWESYGLSHYMLQVKVIEQASKSSCFWELEIQNESIVRRIAEECDEHIEVDGELKNLYYAEPLISNMRTATGVENFFEILRGNLSEEICGPNGCECDGHYDYEIQYHPTLGYPVSIHQIMALPIRNPLAPIIWRGIKAIVPEREVYKWEEVIFVRCTLLGFTLSDYEISITPIQ